MAEKQQRIGNIVLQADQPTSLTINQLHSWAIWRFPKDPHSKNMGLGAVCPPTASLTWLPALIDFEENQILIYGHIDDHFSTPEAACDYFLRPPHPEHSSMKP